MPIRGTPAAWTKTLARQPFGPALLGVVALGFVAFGLYSFAESRARRI